MELSGPPRVSLRLETGLNLPELLIPNHYIGVLRAWGNEPGGEPPMVAVVATLVLCYGEILRQHYLETD